MAGIAKPIVIGLGEVLWDLLPEGKRAGGAPANFAFHAAALGARGLVVSCVGDDQLGRELIARLDSLGVSREYVAVDPAHPTGTVSVSLNADGDATYTIHQDVPEGLESLRKQYRLRIAVLTRGPRGSILCSEQGISERPGAELCVMDTVGAGDAFTAAVVLGFLRGDSLDRVHRHAEEVASFVCTQAGATPALPDSLIVRSES